MKVYQPARSREGRDGRQPGLKRLSLFCLLPLSEFNHFQNTRFYGFYMVGPKFPLVIAFPFLNGCLPSKFENLWLLIFFQNPFKEFLFCPGRTGDKSLIF